MMEQNNEHLSNEKEAQLLIKKIEIECDFHSEYSQDSHSFLQISSPHFSQNVADKKKKKKKKKRKMHFTRPIESEEVKRDFLSNFELDFENQVDLDIFVQYGEFSDYLSLFNQKFHRPEKKICKFSLARLSKSLKKFLVFGENLERLADLFEESKENVSEYSTKDNQIRKLGQGDKVKSLNSLDEEGVRSWKSLQKSLSLQAKEMRKVPPGLNRFVKGDVDSKFKLRNLNPYQMFIELPEDKKSVLSSSPKDILPNLDKSRGEAANSDFEDLVSIISRKKNLLTSKASNRNSMAVSINRNSFLTQQQSIENSTLNKLNSQSTMNQTRVTDKSSSNCLQSKANSTIEKKESMDDEDKFSIYDKTMSKGEIANIINRLNPKNKSAKEKERFSEVINYRTSLNPQDSISSNIKRNNSEEDDKNFQIKITSYETSSSASNTELRPKRSIFSQMGNASKQDCYSIKEDHIEEEEDEASSHSLSVRDSFKNRISKSSSNKDSFLLPIQKKAENHLKVNLVGEAEPKLIKNKTLNSDFKSKIKTPIKSDKKLKIKKKITREYKPIKKKLNSFKQQGIISPHINQPMNSQTINSPNYPTYNKQSPLMTPANQVPMQNANYNPQYQMNSQYNHFQMNPSMPPNMMRYPQPQMPVYAPRPMFVAPMYPNYPNFPMQGVNPSGGYMSNMYLQSQPMFYNMQPYAPPMQNNTSMGSIRTQDSFNNSNGETKSQEINSFNK